MAYFLMYFAFFTTLSIESSNSNLLKFKREVYLKFQITKGRISTQPGHREPGMGPEIKCHHTHSSLLLCCCVCFILSDQEPPQVKEHSYQQISAPPTHSSVGFCHPRGYKSYSQALAQKYL